MRKLTGCLVAIGGSERAPAQKVASVTRRFPIEIAVHWPWMIGHACEKTTDEAVREIAVASPGLGRFI
jgi:hypothetical protein